MQQVIVVQQGDILTGGHLKALVGVAGNQLILFQLLDVYKRQVFHGVKISDNALIAAATLSDRYITDRFLPDKAIDLVDEACAMIKTEMDSMPSEMDDLAHRITQLQIEQVSLKKETDALSQSRLHELEKELAELQDKFRSMKAKWENEKNAIGKVQTLREQIEQTNAAIEKAQREYDLNKAAELKYGKLPELQKQLEAEEKLANEKKEDSLLRDRVTDEEIARIVARWTGIPVEKLVEGEREKLLHLDDVLHQRVIGQDEAVTKAVSYTHLDVYKRQVWTRRWIICSKSPRMAASWDWTRGSSTR